MIKPLLCATLIFSMNTAYSFEISKDNQLLFPENTSFSENSIYPASNWNGHKAMEISSCIENTNNCLSIKLNQPALISLISGKTLKNKSESNINLTGHATIDDSFYGIYRDYDSLLVMKVKEHLPNNKSLTLIFNIVVVKPNGQNYDWLVRKNESITLEGSQYEKLMSMYPDSNQKWYLVSNIMNDTGFSWLQASDDVKLSTAANIYAYFYNENQLAPQIQKSLKGMNDLKPYAQQLVATLDQVYTSTPEADQDPNLYLNQTVSSTAVILLNQQGQLSIK